MSMNNLKTKFLSLLLVTALVITMMPMNVFALDSVEKTITAISVYEKPSKVKYEEGTDELDVTGGVLKVFYSDDSNTYIDMTLDMVSGFDNTVVGKQQIIVSYAGRNGSFEVEVIEKNPSSIKVTSTPIKLEYVEGTELDVAGGEITLTYDDGYPDKIIEMNSDMISGYDNLALGQQTLLVTYLGKTDSFSITVVEKGVESIDLNTLPNKLEYIVNTEALNVDGGILDIVYDNGTTERINMTIDMVSGFDNTNVGEQELLVSYKNKTTNYNIIVLEENMIDFAGGTGSKEHPFLIANSDHLDNVRNYSNAHFKMIDDIEFDANDFEVEGVFYNDGLGWNPIDNFTGTFDGCEFSIKGIVSKEGGVFDFINGATVENLILIDNKYEVDTTDSKTIHFGGITNRMNNSCISNCHNMGDIMVNSKGRAYVGGIVGNTGDGENAVINCTNSGNLIGTSVGGIVSIGNSVSIINCYNTGNIRAYASSDVGANAGGVAATSRGEITNCYNKGTVDLVFENSLENYAYSHYAAGIVGDGYNTDVTNCNNSGNISCNAVNSSVYLGGVVGMTSDGTISNCYNIGSLKGTGVSKAHSTVDHIKVGGVVGEARGKSVVNACYNTGTIESVAISTDAVMVAFAGGVAGNVSDSGTKVFDCYSTGDIEAKHTLEVEKDGSALAGGAFGAVMNYSSVFNCYSVGDVTAYSTYGNAKYGGVSGQAKTGNVSSCYFLDVLENGVGDGNGTVVQGEIEEFETSQFFVDFDFGNVWTMDGNEGYKFPELKKCIMQTCKTEGTHIYIVSKSEEPTCTETGLEEGKYCLICRDVLVAQEEIMALGHEEVVDRAVAATCTKSGLTEGSHCSRCNETIVAQKTTSAIGHSCKTVITKATTNSNGSSKQVCSVCGDVESTTTIYKISSVILSTSAYTCDGKTKSPSVTVKDFKGNKLTKGEDYTVTYGSSSRSAIGRYSVKVNFRGEYSGSKTLYFTIGPKNPSSVSAKLYGYDDVKVSWKKVSGATGYIVYYKKSTATSWASKSTTGTSVKLANLSDGVKYDIKVVTYKTKSGYKCYNAGKTTSIYTLKTVPGVKAVKSGTKVKVSWTNISGETGYQISKSTKKSGTSVVATYKTTSGKSKTISATKGKTYYYKVRAYKVVDGKKIYGPWSSVIKYKR